jgi:hypothetical protein
MFMSDIGVILSSRKVESRCLFGHLAGSASLELLLFIPALVFSRQGNRAITSRDNRIATYCGMKS